MCYYPVYSCNNFSFGSVTQYSLNYHPLFTQLVIYFGSITQYSHSLVIYFGSITLYSYSLEICCAFSRLYSLSPEILSNFCSFSKTCKWHFFHIVITKHYNVGYCNITVILSFNNTIQILYFESYKFKIIYSSFLWYFFFLMTKLMPVWWCRLYDDVGFMMM